MMLDVDIIGETAGKVWEYLNKHGESSRAELKRGLNFSDLQVGTALGWLAREEKLDFVAVKNTFRVSLV